MTEPACSQAMLDIGMVRELHLAELNELHAQIHHKQNELLVYSNAKQLIKGRSPGEKCLVFLADNIFVMRTREQALEILERQIIGIQNSQQLLTQERTVLEERVRMLDCLNITSEGLVEIREQMDESRDPKKPARRVAHLPLKEQKMNKQEKDRQQNPAEEEAQRPKGISEEDYKKFAQLVDSLELSASSDDEEEEEEDVNMEKQHLEPESTDPAENRSRERKKVHFEIGDSRANGNTSHGKCMKSILKNRSEHSPIDEDALRKMEQREQSQLVPTSKETLGDEIVERNLNHLVPGPKETLRNGVKEKNDTKSRQSAVNKKQTKKNRPMSRWKAKKMGLSVSDDEDETDA